MKNKYFKLGLAALTMMVGTAIQAQDTTNDFTKQGNATPGTTGTSVRVIDNKGTIKYLQVANGLTSFTNSTADKTTTTWQLGGTLTDATYIDVNGFEFALDGIELVDTSVLAASTDATDQSDHGTGSGWTLLVRDELTGATKKLLATDLIQSGQTYFTVATDGDTSFDGATSTTGQPGTLTAAAPLPAFSQVIVYRNGAKLFAGLDYTITAPSTVTLVPQTATGRDWSTIVGDIIEVHYIK